MGFYIYVYRYVCTPITALHIYVDTPITVLHIRIQTLRKLREDGWHAPDEALVSKPAQEAMLDLTPDNPTLGALSPRGGPVQDTVLTL